MKTIRKKDGNTLLQCVNTMVEVLRKHQVQLVTWEYVGAAFRSISAAAPQKMSVIKQNPGMLKRMLKFLHVSGDDELGWNPNFVTVRDYSMEFARYHEHVIHRLMQLVESGALAKVSIPPILADVPEHMLLDVLAGTGQTLDAKQTDRKKPSEGTDLPKKNEELSETRRRTKSYPKIFPCPEAVSLNENKQIQTEAIKNKLRS